MRRADSSLAQQGGEEFCTFERFRRIHEEIPTLGTLNFMGDGEPLMNPELNDIIHYASLNNIHTVITTNATLITQEAVDLWKHNKVYRIHASVDASSGEVYESTRVGAKFRGTLENLRIIGRSEIPLCINVVLLEHNMDEMPRMARLAHSVGAKEITYLMPICAYETDVETRPKVSERNRSLFRETSDICIALGLKWVFPLTLDPTFRRFSFPFIRPEISIEGDLWACCYSLGRGRNWVMGHPIDIAPGTYNMGNMFKEGFREVWYGPAYQELREVYKSTEIPKGTVISRGEYLDRILEVEGRTSKHRFDHCEICPARWGVACS